MQRSRLFLFSFFLFISASHITGQVIYNSLPMDSELVARDLKTNMGTITIAGEVLKTKTTPDSIAVKLFRDSKLIETQYRDLHYSGDTASFNFALQIPAELHEYSVSVYLISHRAEWQDTTIKAIVAGDVYLIEGQSNALATMRDSGSANGNKSEFIRTFALPDTSVQGLMHHLVWYQGEGDGSVKENGHVGQWGLRLGRLLVDNMKIPVALFNGAFGGTPISYYSCPGDYKKNLKSNYARVYYRLKATGLEKNVRAVIWSQGESDAESGNSSVNYKNIFIVLQKAWQEDYPGIEKTYIFQTSVGNSGISVNSLLAVAEGQRQMDVENKDIEIIPTYALKSDKGGLHFVYKGGYEEFGNRLYPLIARDLYNIKSDKEIDAPMINNAYLSDTNVLVLVESTNSLQEHTVANGVANASIDTSIILKNKIITRLYKRPPKNTGACLPYRNPLLVFTNSNNIEILSFYNYPIIDSVSAIRNGLKKHISVGLCHRLFHKGTSLFVKMSGTHYLEFFNTREQRTKWVKFSGRHYTLNTISWAKDCYSIHVYDDELNLLGTTELLVQ